MRAVILAGGKGMRLRPYTTVLPKPLMPVGDRPILALIIRQLAGAGFTHIDLSVGHLGELVQAYFAGTSGIPEGVALDYYWEETPLGTAGALREIDPPEDSFLVMNGDVLTTIDYAELMRFHAEREAALTIATLERNVQLSLGVIEGEDGTVSGFIEKPSLHYEVSMGVYAYSRRALQYVPEAHFDFPELVLALLAAGERVAAFRYEGEWFDIGTPDEYERAITAYAEDSKRFEPSQGHQ